MLTKWNKILLGVLAVQLAILAGARLVATTGGQKTGRPLKLFPKLDGSTVTEIRVADGEGHVQELRKEAGRWVLASGGGYPVKEAKVTELLGKLPTLMAGEPVTENPAHHRALEVGAEGFQRSVAITTKGGPPVKFFLGSSPGIKNVHLRRDGEKAVYLVKDLSAWDVGAMATDWVESDYFKSDRDAIVEMRLKNGSGEVALAKRDSKWTLEGVDLDEGQRVKQTEVDTLLGSASSVPLFAPVSRGVEPKFGLDKPAATITIVVEEKEKDKDGKPKADAPGKKMTRVLAVGAKDGEHYFIKSGDAPFVVKAAAWAVEPFLQKKQADFIEKEKPEDKNKDGASSPPPPMPEGLEPAPPSMEE
jgi:hypothetical protein